MEPVENVEAVVPADAAPEASAPVEEPAPAVPADAAPVEAVTSEPVAPVEPAEPFVSLYGSVATTIAAVVLGIFIVGGIQFAVTRIFSQEKNPHRALTQFVTMMVAIMVGVFVSDMLIAGPNVELLNEAERVSILGFVKDTALMIFAYYFGTQSAASKDET